MACCPPMLPSCCAVTASTAAATSGVSADTDTTAACTSLRSASNVDAKSAGVMLRTAVPSAAAARRRSGASRTRRMRLAGEEAVRCAQAFCTTASRCESVGLVRRKVGAGVAELAGLLGVVEECCCGGA